MKVSSKIQYAIMALLDLAYHYRLQDWVSLRDIARRRNISVKYLENIMLQLRRAGYVISRRGMGGGFALAKSPRQVTLAEIILLIEDQEILGRPAARLKHDAHSGKDASALEEVWDKVTDATSNILHDVTLARVIDRSKELQAEIGDFGYQI